MDTLFIIEGIILIGSNIALLPSIWYAANLGLIPEVAIISTVFTVSTIYHLCQVGFVCILDMEVGTFQLLDQFFVYSLFVWMTFYFIGLELQYRFAILVLIQAILIPLLIEFSNTWWFAGIIIGIVAVVSLLLLSLVVRGLPRFNPVSLFVAILLLGIGFTLHVVGGEPFHPDSDLSEQETISRYSWFHSVWHIFAMLAVYYILDTKREGWISRLYNFTSNGDHYLNLSSSTGTPLPIYTPSQVSKERVPRNKKKRLKEPPILTLNKSPVTKDRKLKKVPLYPIDNTAVLRYDTKKIYEQAFYI